MPLRDHFRSPLDDKRSWDELHGMWPAVIVQNLVRALPEGYFAAAGVHLGTLYEIDIATFSDESYSGGDSEVGNAGGVATATWAPPKPSVIVQPHLPLQDEYEVRIYDERKGRRLVAAIELISSSNKDRQEHRGTFVSKVAALLKQNVCVSLVDVVSTRHFNLYSELLALLEQTDPMLGEDPSPMYAATVRCRREKGKLSMDGWYDPFGIGSGLPVLPIGSIRNTQLRWI
jgi:hypothetical protein